MKRSIRIISFLSVLPAALFLAATAFAASGHRTQPFGGYSAEPAGAIAGQDQDKLHTPAPGTPERKAIMDALRADMATGGYQNVVFKVYVLKVHNGWAWTDVTPLDQKGKAVAEGGPQLLHNENGVWKVKDLSVIPEDPDDPLAPEDLTPKFVKAVMKAFPGCPADIFVKSKSK